MPSTATPCSPTLHLTACPSWDSGCTSNPFNNLNSLSNAPAARHPQTARLHPTTSGTNNTYEGPWALNAWNYGPCNYLPTDPTTGQVDAHEPRPLLRSHFATWQSDWQQDAASTYTPTVPIAHTHPPRLTPTATTQRLQPPPPRRPARSATSTTTARSTFSTSPSCSNWGTTNATADINHDGTVNIFDLSILLSHWGT